MADLELDSSDLVDEIIPNEGGSSMFMAEPDAEQEQELREEKSMITGAGDKLIAHIIAWFDEAIANANNITSLDLQSTVPLEAQIEAAQQFVAMMQVAKSNIVSLRDDHLNS